MSKRFTDTNKYKKPFLRALQGPYKLLWDFLYHECDHAGIWIVDFTVAQIYIGDDMPVNYQDALKYFNADSDDIKVVVLDGGKKWFLPSFIEFQYGILNDKNRVHASVISILDKYRLWDFDKNKPLTSPLQGAKYKDKDKELDKDLYEWVVKNCINVQKLQNPITEDQAAELEKEFGIEQCKKLFSSMENRKDLLKKYTSANLTFRNWMSRDIKPTDLGQKHTSEDHQKINRL